MSGDDDDRFAAWAATEDDAVADPVKSVSSDSGFATKDEPAVRRGRVLAPPPRLAHRQAGVLVGEVRCRRSWPLCFTTERGGKRWRLWGIGANSPVVAQRASCG